MSERDQALAAATMQYCKKVCGQAPPTTVIYHGSFDYHAVVNAAPIPKSSHVDEHRKAWGEFRRIFSEEWEINDTKALIR